MPTRKIIYTTNAIESLNSCLILYIYRLFFTSSNFHIITGDFCNVELPSGSCDLIFSATAFHWLPFEEAVHRVKKALRPGGTLALFWNHPFPNREDDPTNMASKKIYDKYRPSSKKQVEFSEDNLAVWKERLLNAGFGFVEAKLYRRKRVLTTDQYIGLLNTYSDHIALPEETKRLFEREMRRSIDSVGGFINIYDTIETDDYKEITHKAIVTLAKFYGVTSDYLLGLTENREQHIFPVDDLFQLER